MWRGEGMRLVGDMVLGKVCVSARWGSATDGDGVTGRQLSTTYARAYSSVGVQLGPVSSTLYPMVHISSISRKEIWNTD